MGVGMCSTKKSSSGGSVVVWFVVLGLALLVGAAAAQRKHGSTAVHLPDWYCEEGCHGKQDYMHCYRRCRASPIPSSGAGLRLASHMGAGEEETRGGGGGAALVGKQGNMVIHPPWSCELECEDIVDPDFDPDSYMACVRECYLGFRKTVRRRAEVEEARQGGGGGGGGGGASLLAMPARSMPAGKKKKKGRGSKRTPPFT